MLSNLARLGAIELVCLCNFVDCTALSGFRRCGGVSAQHTCCGNAGSSPSQRPDIPTSRHGPFSMDNTRQLLTAGQLPLISNGITVTRPVPGPACPWTVVTPESAAAKKFKRILTLSH